MKKLFFIVLAAGPLWSHACSYPPGYKNFYPNTTAFRQKLDSGLIARLPKPKINAVTIKRGTAAPGASCDDAGVLSLEVEWPAASVYQLNEVGFYFRVLSGAQPDQIFPLEPVVGSIDGQRAKFRFFWLDGAPSSQQPLNLDVEIFAVNKGLEIGPSQRFSLSKGVRSQHKQN